MEQYFASDPSCESSPVSYTYRFREREFVFETDAGVFSKGETDFGTDLLLNSLPPLTGRTLDLGCGFGVIGICLAATEPVEAVLSDVNRRALALAAKNAEKNHVRAEIRESDGFSNLSGLFDQIVTNPPIRTGKQQIYALFAQSAAHLKEDGRLYLVIRRQQGAESAKAYLGTLFASVETLARKKGFYVFCCSGKAEQNDDQGGTGCEI